MKKPPRLRFIIAVLAATAGATLAALTVSQPASGAEAIEYQVVDGAVLVFGHRLETKNPLPKIGDCEGCGAIGFHRSPDGRWVLIVSDARFTDNDIWLYDTMSRTMPRHLVGRRRGRHLDTGWLTDSVFELRWAGMGYSTSLLFDAGKPTAGKVLDGLLLYDAERNVYVRYDYDDGASTDTIEIGPVFTRTGNTEHFTIELDYDYRSDWMSRIENVRIDGPQLVVTYNAKSRGLVSDGFAPQLLSGAR